MTQRLYDRTSRSISYDDLDPALRAAIEQHADERLLGPVRPVAAVDTHSVNLKRKGGLFGRLAGRSEKEHRTVALLLPQALVVVTTGAERGVVVMSTRLADISRIGADDPRLVVDSGMRVESRWNVGNDVASYYVGLGDDPAGHEFRERLRAAVVAARQ
ncbi:hypothetical protein AB0M46_25175 [Dactylosporangium sp. NPDC051485]|uniref:hypothetical protein n=1 Tax=Dactylosporangium sp. NPDC051485 TaxID=3154846 RepID=UPI003424346C